MPCKVTVDDMVRAVQQADRPLTAQDIARSCGVTRQTISNHREKLEKDSRVSNGKVGTATAYWENKNTDIPELGTLKEEYPNAEKIEIRVAGSFVEGWFIPKDHTKSTTKAIVEKLKPW